MVVDAKDWSGFNMSLSQLFGKGPKFTIRCGNCDVDFDKRIPMTDYPRVSCPNCGTVNRLPLVWNQ